MSRKSETISVEGPSRMRLLQWLQGKRKSEKQCCKHTALGLQ